MCIRHTGGYTRHDVATDYCDTNYNGATLPVITSKAQNDELNAAWTAYLGGTWAFGSNHYWLGYQLETGVWLPAGGTICHT